MSNGLIKSPGKEERDKTRQLKALICCDSTSILILHDKRKNLENHEIQFHTINISGY